MPQILFEKRDGIAYITLNRPEKRNALSPEMVVRLAELWDEIASDNTVRVVLLMAGLHKHSGLFQVLSQTSFFSGQQCI